jgi:hypothetical protein
MGSFPLASPTYASLPPEGISFGAVMAALTSCPDCPTTEQVRWLVLHDDPWTNLAIAALPFAFVAAVALWVHGAEGTRR